MSANPPSAHVLRESHELDRDALERFLKTHVPALLDQGASTLAPEIPQFATGFSNPTFLLHVISHNGTVDMHRRWLVLRKQPKGQLLPGAHNVDREFQVMHALNQAGAKIDGRTVVPKVHVLCNDLSVLGTNFYVMDYVEGRIFRDYSLPDLTPSERTACFKDMCRILSNLHCIDWKAIGLERFGRPGNYYARQIATWTRQYRCSQTHEIPPMEQLIQWLPKNLTNDDADPTVASLVHGDFKLDNIIFHPTEPKIAAVLDWELSTIGHPLADLAYNCMFYHIPLNVAATAARADGRSIPGVGGLDLASLGIPSEQQYIESYFANLRQLAPLSGRIPTSLPSNWGFYLAFAFFRLAGICQGVYFRALKGTATVSNSQRIRELPIMLSEIGWKIVCSSNPSPSFPVPASASKNDGIGFAQSPKVEQLCQQLNDFMKRHIFPNEKVFKEQLSSMPSRWQIPPVMIELEQLARQHNMCNFFLPPLARQDPITAPFAQNALTNVDYSPLCEIMGRSFIAAEVFNCNAPNSGNMEMLFHFGTAEQKRKWLVPLLEGRIKSCFAMTEPNVASSDATNIALTIRRDGDHYVLNGTKWWVTGAKDPRCKVVFVLGRQVPPPSRGRHNQHSIIFCPMDTPGIRVGRALTTFGFDDAPFGHCEMFFENVRVPVENMILGEGSGFEIAQGRLGPGRTHHMMRLIGMAERTLELVCQRADERISFGKPLSKHSNVQMEIARARIQIDQARLLILKCAWKMDVLGTKAARYEISAIKVVVPSTVCRIVDWAVQMFGAAGFCDDHPLAFAMVAARALRIADGPDEVHLLSLGRLELYRQRQIRDSTQERATDDSDQSLSQQFLRSTRLLYRIRNLPTEDTLQFYGLFKQATRGDCDLSQAPSEQDRVAFSKFQSWNAQRGMSKEEAMQAYVLKVASFFTVPDSKL